MKMKSAARGRFQAVMTTVAQADMDGGRHRHSSSHPHARLYGAPQSGAGQRQRGMKWQCLGEGRAWWRRLSFLVLVTCSPLNPGDRPHDDRPRPGGGGACGLQRQGQRRPRALAAAELSRAPSAELGGREVVVTKIHPRVHHAYTAQ